VSFAVADILAQPSARYAAILCRGVLNDIIDDDRRDAVFAAFAPFVMRCREREELSMLFARHGFGNIQYFGAYDQGVEPGPTDRLVAVAQLSDNPDTP
jgi:hypothetical protein